MKAYVKKRTSDIQDTMDALYDELDELQEMVNALLEENDRLRKMTQEEKEQEEKMCDDLYRQWFKESYGVYPEDDYI